MGWTIGVLGFDSRRVLGIFLFTTASRKGLGPTQPPIQFVPGTLSLGVKRSGREADDSPPSSAEVKKYVELYLHSPSTPSLRGDPLRKKHRYTFTFYVCCRLVPQKRMSGRGQISTCSVYMNETSCPLSLHMEHN
jgi:hypothetical protein